MTKRVRGAARTHRRPGTRPASERGAPAHRRPTVAFPPSELEGGQESVELVIEEQSATVATAAAAESSVRSHTRQRVKPGSLLATRAATEYVYVAKDMRRITLVAGLLVALMLVLWLLLVVLRVVPLPFY